MNCWQRLPNFPTRHLVKLMSPCNHLSITLEIGEQGEINGKESGEDQVPLTELKKDHGIKS